MKFTLRGERINFTDEWVKTKSRDEFIASQTSKVWQSVDKKIRDEELGKAWDMITGVKEEKPLTDEEHEVVEAVIETMAEIGINVTHKRRRKTNADIQRDTETATDVQPRPADGGDSERQPSGDNEAE